MARRWGRTAVDVLLSDCQYRKGTALYGQCVWVLMYGCGGGGWKHGGSSEDCFILIVDGQRRLLGEGSGGGGGGWIVM